MKSNTLTGTAFLIIALMSFCIVSNAQQPEEPDIFEQAEAEADRLQRVLDLEDW